MFFLICFIFCCFFHFHPFFACVFFSFSFFVFVRFFTFGQVERYMIFRSNERKRKRASRSVATPTTYLNNKSLRFPCRLCDWCRRITQPKRFPWSALRTFSVKGYMEGHLPCGWTTIWQSKDTTSSLCFPIPTDGLELVASPLDAERAGVTQQKPSTRRQTSRFQVLGISLGRDLKVRTAGVWLCKSARQHATWCSR